MYIRTSGCVCVLEMLCTVLTYLGHQKVEFPLGGRGGGGLGIRGNPGYVPHYAVRSSPPLPLPLPLPLPSPSPSPPPPIPSSYNAIQQLRTILDQSHDGRCPSNIRFCCSPVPRMKGDIPLKGLLSHSSEQNIILSVLFCS